MTESGDSMDDLREIMRQERLSHWADNRMDSNLKGAMLSAISCLSNPAPWIPGACFSISSELAPFLRAAMVKALQEDVGHGG